VRIARRYADLEDVAAVLAAAGIAVPHGLGTGVPNADGSRDLFTYDAAGQPVELPAGAATALANYAPVRVKTPAEYRADYVAAVGRLQAGRADLLTAQGAYTAATTALGRENALRDGLVALNAKVEALNDKIDTLAKAFAVVAADRVADT
jgi:hypothetical protein